VAELDWTRIKFQPGFEAITRFHRSGPEVGVDVRHLSTGDQATALREGSADVAAVLALSTLQMLGT
jgi:hypothetical protein